MHYLFYVIAAIVLVGWIVLAAWVIKHSFAPTLIEPDEHEAHVGYGNMVRRDGE